MTRAGIFLFVSLLATACSDAVELDEPAVAQSSAACALACNGAPQLCDRRYDQVSYATTHNAMSAGAEGWIHSDQRYGIARQLSDGIRALMLDVHELQGEPYLCHGSACATGKRKLVDGLRDIARFMRHNPDEVVTIIFEPYVDPAQIRDALVAVGLDTQLHVQDPAQPWPTLRQLIERHQRLVVFTEHDGGAFPWFHDVWQFAWDTNWEFYRPEDMNCNPNRGSVANGLFIFNNIMVTDDDAEAFAHQINVNPFLLGRAQECQDASGKRANFVTVDYYDVGDLFSVVRTLNGLEAAP
jgi:hypothetical protein